jgi:hypothetical protein
MKINVRIPLAGLLVLAVLLVSSCSAPAYRQNKYKSAKRYNDCGCQYKPMDNQTMVCLNENK